MKKIIFVLAASVFCFQVAGFSQTRVGLAGGVSVANMKNKVDGDPRAGLMFSLVLDGQLCKKNKNWGFQPSLAYVQKGLTEPHPTGTLIDKQYVALRYMELTADFTYNLIKNTKSTIYVGAGPSIDFNIPSKRVSVTDGDRVTTDILFGETLENDFKGVDYGYDIRAGLRMNGGFFISLNYNKGLRNLVTGEAAGKIHNEYIGIQLGVYLNNGKKDK